MSRKRKTPGRSATGGESGTNERRRDSRSTKAMAVTVAVGLVLLCLTGAIKGYSKPEPPSTVYHPFAEGVLDRTWNKAKVSAGWPPRRCR